MLSSVKTVKESCYSMSKWSLVYWCVAVHSHLNFQLTNDIVSSKNKSFFNFIIILMNYYFRYNSFQLSKLRTNHYAHLPKRTTRGIDLLCLQRNKDLDGGANHIPTVLHVLHDPSLDCLVY
jgi:hypothetical protein